MDSLEHPASAFDPFWGDPAFRTGSADPWGAMRQVTSHTSVVATGC
jgi:hypothetical protein